LLVDIPFPVLAANTRYPSFQVAARSKNSEFADLLNNAQERARAAEERVAELDGLLRDCENQPAGPQPGVFLDEFDSLKNKLGEQRHQIETLEGQLAMKNDQEVCALYSAPAMETKGLLMQAAQLEQKELQASLTKLSITVCLLTRV